ncbi:MAG: hypothetical protein JW749_09720 [Sedimentisphaerales bacterium]|nr:hypothetical protein [Sedimentisphaerales bacterium]
MKIIKGVLKEELGNSLQMKQSFERELVRLPKGNLVKKTIKGRQYYYLQIRNHGKVRFIYKGRVSQREIEKYQQAKHYRAKYRKQLSEVKKQIRFLRSVLRGKEPV